MRTHLGAVAALLLLAPAAAGADERILRYLSDVQIQKDGSIEVAETIDVRAEHDRINHGIYRDFPTRYLGPHGTQFHVRFTFEGATLDGSSVKASVQPSGVGLRIKLGDPNNYVAVGEHEYTIRYNVTREIGRFPGFDELYWNATGTQWIFPIDEATARIRLPEPVKFGARHVYTGPSGSRASDAQVIGEAPGEITFQTTRSLGPYEGLTIAAAFPKGIVAQPTSGSRLLDALDDYGPPLLGLLALLGLCGFYYVAWTRAGRNPRKGTVVPIFTPPDDLSPAGMRYVTKMGADNRAFAAALVDMGVRGHIKLVEEDRGWLSGKHMRLERLAGKEPLPEEEESALDCLCRPGEDIMMEQKNHDNFSAAQSALQGILKVRYEGTLFKRNIGWAAAGLFIFIACFWLVCAAIDLSTGGALVWQVGVVLGILIACALLWLAFHETATGKCLLSLLGFVAVGTAVVLGMPIFADALGSGWWLPLVLPLIAAPLVLSAFWWIAAPTTEGRKVLDHIAGFKQYLSITETDRLDRMTPPKDTPELFEKYLPFAIA
ncbi:MAG TPA: DUF2207 domain-containing protein, partial [Sphingomicrobium sp.]|nr:DUF2207 domain-containing protein [Sphingomicrobium sp.]